MLGIEPHVALLAWEVLKVLGPTLMGHFISGPWLARPLKVSRAIKPQGAIKVRRPLLEAHGCRSRTRTHVVKVTWCFKALHWALRVSRSWSWSRTLISYRRLLSNWTSKPARPLRGSLKPPHAFPASRWTMNNVPGTIDPLRHVVMGGSAALKPTGPRMVRSLKLRVIKAPRAAAFIPSRGVWPGGAHMAGAIVPRRGVPTIMRRRVPRGAGVLADRRPQASKRMRCLEDGFRGRVRRNVQGPVVRVLAVWTLKAWNRTHVRRVLL